MIRIFKTTDLIPVRVGEITFWVSPLSLEKKAALSALVNRSSGVVIENALDAAVTAIRHSLKRIDGVETAGGAEYELEFENGALTDSCIAELMQLDALAKLTHLLINWEISNIRDPKDLYQDYAKKIEALVAVGELAREAADRMLSKYPLEGVTVDFNSVTAGTKKKIPATQD